jgi:hypothetical protein
MMLQAIVEPIVLTLKADQYSSRFPVPGDEDFFVLRQTQKSRQIVLYLSQGRLAHWASRAQRASAQLQLS